MKITLAFTLLLINSMALAIEKSDQQLFDELSHMDSLLFNKAFNSCQLKVLETITHQDFEFYHDKGGAQDRNEFINAFKQNICSSPENKPIRKLAAGSLTVFRMRDNGKTYGALQSGEHDFYIRKPGQEMVKTNVAKFINLWVIESDEWKLKRVLSFDHQQPSLHYPSAAVEQEIDAGFRPRLFGYETEIRALLTQHKVPSIALGIIENGQLQQVRVISTQDTAPMDGLYNVASLTKPVVALVVLKLINDGRWRLDSALAQHYVDADLRNHPMLNKLTTRYVLSHQSGLPNWRYQATDNKLDFEFEPGSRYQYSGEGFEYLRKAVEAKFKRPFEEIAQRELFDPLGMSDTHFYWTDQVDQRRYQLEHDDQGVAIPLQKHFTSNAADNLVTTAADYSKFMLHILNGAGLKNDLYQEMLSEQVSIKANIGFALGWQRFDNLQSANTPEEQYALQHTGSDLGTRALALMLPNSKRGLVVLSNSENASKLWTKIVSEHFSEVGDNLMSANFR